MIRRFQLGKGLVAAAIVYKDDFVRVTAVPKGVYYALLEGGYIFFFVVAWNNQRQLHFLFPSFFTDTAIICLIVYTVKNCEQNSTANP